MTDRDQLIAEAEERWGDEWFLETVRHADGDEHHRVHHTVEILADGVVIRDVLREIDGMLAATRHVIDEEEYLVEVDR